MPNGSARVPDAGLRVARERAAAGPIIHGFGPRGFRIEDNHFPALLLTVTAARSWTPPPLAALDMSALAPVLDPTPEFVLIGTGATIARAPATLVAALEARGIGVETMDSRAAARAWGVLRGEGRRIAAAFYPLDA